MAEEPTQVLKVYLGSVAPDLVDSANKIRDILRESDLPLEIVESRPFPESIDLLVRTDTYDALVIMVGEKYGQVPQEDEGGDGEKSIAWLELEAALDAQKRIEIFILHERLYDEYLNFRLSAKGSGLSGREALVNVRRLGPFRAFLEDRFKCNYFTTSGDLVEKVVSRIEYLVKDMFLNRATKRLEEVADDTLEKEFDRKAIEEYTIPQIEDEEVHKPLEQVEYDITKPDSVKLHVDRPAEVDQLGRTRLAEHIALRIRAIRHEDIKKKLGPFRINLHGSWGSGKSTILNFLREFMCRDVEKHLESNPSDRKLYQDVNKEPWIVVEFNAWEHQRLDPPWWSLMDRVYRQALQQIWRLKKRRRVIWLWISENWQRVYHNLVPTLLTIVFFGIFVYFGWKLVVSIITSDYLDETKVVFQIVVTIVTLLFTCLGIISGIFKGFFLGSSRAAKSFQTQKGDPMRRIGKHFDKIIKRIRNPVVVFVDDLDRCDAEYVVSLLEGIQTVFGKAGVYYVVAADRRWVRTAYETFYHQFSHAIIEPGKPIGTLLLEKTFQLSVSVPSISEETTREFWDRLLDIKPEEREKEMEEASIKAREEMSELMNSAAMDDRIERESNPIIKQALRQEKVVQLARPDIVKGTEHILRRYAPLLDRNPRSMKRLVNSYGIRQALVSIASIPILPEQLALWTILDMRWPELGEYLEQHPDTLSQIREPPEELSESIPKNLHELFRDSDVFNVVNGIYIEDGKEVRLGVELDEETIRSCRAIRS